MAHKTPAQVQAFLDENSYRMDGSVSWLGDEPNSYRKPWESASVRVSLFANWVYQQAAGNQAIPLVYRVINEYREDFLCDRSYFFETPRDLKLFEEKGIPVFGIESKHQLRDFDVVGTSISYSVLTINFVKQLMMSDIPPTWEDRQTSDGQWHEGRNRNPEKWPFVIVGGQVYGAPEVVANIVDAVFCGEVEDEPGNPGLGAVLDRIDKMKKSGRWSTDRVACYADLAREFNFLYFPMFTDVHYGYEDRPSVAKVCEQYGKEARPSKQVIGITTNISGLRAPFTKRFVRDMNAVEGLTNPPLLYVDPGMGSGDVEVGRGCPAWCGFCALCLGGETTFITRDGVRRLDESAGTVQEVWTSEGWVKADIAQHGEDRLNTITLVPAHKGWSEFAQREVWKRNRGDFTITHRATALHRWPLAAGGETHHLEVGDFVAAQFVDEANRPDYLRGWVHGLVFGDGTLDNGLGRNSYGVLIRKDQPELLERLLAVIKVNSVTAVSEILNRVRFWDTERLKEFPKERSASYVRGFIEGWDAADGTTRSRREDRLRINSQHPEAQAWLRENAAYGGWVLTGVFQRKSLETNYGTRKNPACEYNLSRIGAWKVVSIESGSEVEPVYCATVPGVGFWTLATGCYTGNTYRQKPYRQRSVAKVTETARELHQNTGGIHVAPFSPDFPMYTEKKALIASLLENVTDDIDASSMRVDDFIADSQYITLQAYAGMDTVTLGVEGNSQRMRDLVGKGAADEDVKEAVARGIQAGIRKFKLYMIASLPGEDEGDIEKAIHLAKQLADIRDTMNAKVQIHFSWTPMLIEGNTPFQWFAPTPANYSLGEVFEKFRELNVYFKLGGKSQRDKALYFQLSQRASREVGMALIEAVAEMNLGAWGGAPKGLYEAVEARLYARGFLNGIADCYDERQKHDLFGWEMVDQGINTELLWVTYQQMVEFLENTESETYDEDLTDDYHGNEWIERAFVGGTLVQTVEPEGVKLVPIAEMAERSAQGETFWVVSKTEEGRDVVAHVPRVWSVGEHDDIVEIEFEDGYVVCCTSDHRFLTTNRGWVEAQDLTAKDDIAESDVLAALDSVGHVS